MITSVLFDLDGTLLDTAPDLVFALNQLRHEQGLEALPLSAIRPMVSLGSKKMVKHVLNIDETHPHFSTYRERFLALYQKHIADQTQFFPQVEDVLAFLDDQKIAWGIVTNKLTLHTTHLLTALRIHERPGCIVCGDTLTTYKPDPAPILHACQLLKKNPQQCLYVGDSNTDVLAGKAAGTQALVALYGYISDGENPYTWQANGYIQQPIDIIDWLLKYRET